MAARAGATIEAAVESLTFWSPDKGNQPHAFVPTVLCTFMDWLPGGAEIHHGLAASEGNEPACQQEPRGQWHALFSLHRGQVFLQPGSGRSRREGQRIRERSGGHATG